jgi:hypothetical protein
MLRSLSLAIALVTGTSMGARISGPLPAQATPAEPQVSRGHSFVVVENAGQFNPAVRFQVQTPGEVIWVTDRSLWLSRVGGGEQAQNVDPFPGARSAVGPTGPRGVNLELTFPGNRWAARPVGLDPLPARMSYFLGSDPGRWHSAVHTYGQLSWRYLYPGVSVTLEAVDGRPVLVLHAADSSDLRAVRLAVAGAKALRALPDGQLLADTAIGPVRLPAFLHGGRPLQTDPRGAVVSFADTGTSEAAGRTPSAGSGLLYGTLLGGSSDDYTSGIVVGPDGSTYVAGWTYSADFPTTPGAFDTTNADRDAFISRFDPTGSSLLYSTYLGGSAPDTVLSLAVGPDGNAYVCGYTSSTDFPTTPGAYDTTFDGGFITQLDSPGSTLVYSTFLGPADHGEVVQALALANDGTAYVTGYTQSDDFPTTPGAFDRIINNNGVGDYEDSFVTALNPDGNALVYSTFLGGVYNDYGYGIAVGPDGTAYVTGETQSGDFPTTPRAFDPTGNGGNDSFVTRVNPNGSALAFSTYLGGSADDFGSAVAVDAGGSAYVVGSTDSSDYPTTPGAYDTTINSFIYDDAFATKLDPAGSSLVYSTFLGGNAFDAASGLVLDHDGTLTLVGSTYSSNFPTTPGAFQRSRGGSGDAVLSRFDPTGSYLEYSSYLGGTSVVVDTGFAIAAAGPGVVTATGITESTDFPTTTGAYDTTYNGGFDAFVATLQVARTMHVASIDPAYRQMGQGFLVGARIRVILRNGSPVAGATVKVELEYPDGRTAKLSAQTNQQGVALVSRRTTQTGVYTFTVVGVANPPFVYSSSENIETSDSVAIP